MKAKLAPQNAVATTILVGRDYDTGMVHANELKSTVPVKCTLDEMGKSLLILGNQVRN